MGIGPSAASFLILNTPGSTQRPPPHELPALLTAAISFVIITLPTRATGTLEELSLSYQELRSDSIQVAILHLVGDIWAEPARECEKVHLKRSLAWVCGEGQRSGEDGRVRREMSGNQTFLPSKLAVTTLKKTFYSHFFLIIGLFRKHLQREKCCFLLNLHLKYTRSEFYFPG